LYKLVTIYRRVDDEDALEDFFSSTHLQLAERLPGLLKTEVSRVQGKPGGESRFHLMYELYFDAQEKLFEALASPVGQDLMVALSEWAEARIITWFYAESFAEEAHPPAEKPAAE
jgi:uncharacterized protein (TIGR02118 family)